MGDSVPRRSPARSQDSVEGMTNASVPKTDVQKVLNELAQL